MADLLFILGTIAFFALALAYVRFCDRIVGSDRPGEANDDTTPAATPAEVGR